MPTKLDITGKKFGKLTVIADEGRSQYSGKPVTIWRVECECGTSESYPQSKLTQGRVTMCSNCSRPVCVICDAPIPKNRPRSNTCSDSCNSIKTKKIQLDSYYKRSSEDPEFNQKRHQRVVEKMEINSDFAEHVREVRRQANERYRENHPDRIEEQQRIHWLFNSERILKKRQIRIDAMTPQELRVYKQRMREYDTEWKQQWRDEMYKDSDRHEEFKRWRREYWKNWYYGR